MKKFDEIKQIFSACFEIKNKRGGFPWGATPKRTDLQEGFRRVHAAGYPTDLIHDYIEDDLLSLKRRGMYLNVYHETNEFSEEELGELETENMKFYERLLNSEITKVMVWYRDNVLNHNPK